VFTMSLGLLSPSYPLFQWYLQSKNIWLNLSTECSRFWCCVFLILRIILMTVTWCLKFTLELWLYISKNRFFIFESHEYGSKNRRFLCHLIFVKFIKKKSHDGIHKEIMLFFFFFPTVAVKDPNTIMITVGVLLQFLKTA
jgi:hypothetical protein